MHHFHGGGLVGFCALVGLVVLVIAVLKAAAGQGGGRG